MRIRPNLIEPAALTPTSARGHTVPWISSKTYQIQLPPTRPKHPSATTVQEQKAWRGTYGRMKEPRESWCWFWRSRGAGWSPRAPCSSSPSCSNTVHTHFFTLLCPADTHTHTQCWGWCLLLRSEGRIRICGAEKKPLRISARARAPPARARFTENTLSVTRVLNPYCSCAETYSD